MRRQVKWGELGRTGWKKEEQGVRGRGRVIIGRTCSTNVIRPWRVDAYLGLPEDYARSRPYFSPRGIMNLGWTVSSMAYQAADRSSCAVSSSRTYTSKGDIPLRVRFSISLFFIRLFFRFKYTLNN